MFLFDTSFRLDPPLDKVWLTCRALAALSLISIDFSEVRLCLLSSKSHAPAWALSSPASLATYIKMQSKRKKPVVKCRKTEGKTLKGSVETSGDPWTIFFFSKLLFCKTFKRKLSRLNRLKQIQSFAFSVSHRKAENRFKKNDNVIICNYQYMSILFNLKFYIKNISSGIKLPSVQCTNKPNYTCSGTIGRCS